MYQYWYLIVMPFFNHSPPPSQVDQCVRRFPPKIKQHLETRNCVFLKSPQNLTVWTDKWYDIRFRYLIDKVDMENNFTSSTVAPPDDIEHNPPLLYLFGKTERLYIPIPSKESKIYVILNSGLQSFGYSHRDFGMCRGERVLNVLHASLYCSFLFHCARFIWY